MEIPGHSIQFQTIVNFIRSIGIEVREGNISERAFLPSVEIVNGGIVYDGSQLLYPGDLLHEAGHIALIPGDIRSKLCGNATEQKFTDGGEEMVVMLWSYAAALEAGISPDLVFHSNGYHGQSQWLLDQYHSGNYIGLPLLQWMGLCNPNSTPPGFPHMIKWLRS